MSLISKLETRRVEMSQFVIMENVDGICQAVAIRKDAVAAQTRCVELANLRSQKPRGRVEPIEGGARFTVEGALYMAVEVVDCG